MTNDMAEQGMTGVISFISLVRDYSHPAMGTVGNLEVYDDLGNVQFRCATLENPWRDNKPVVSCIPSGVYKLDKDRAGRFYDAYKERWGYDYVPMIRDGEVPGRSQILFHAGNDVSHTSGCILLGESVKNITSYATPYLNWGKAIDEDFFRLRSSRRVYTKFWDVVEKCNPEYIRVEVKGVIYKEELPAAQLRVRKAKAAYELATACESYLQKMQNDKMELPKKTELPKFSGSTRLAGWK